MGEFQFAGQEKFALVAVESVFTDFPDDPSYSHQLSDGIWIFSRIPVTIDTYWKERIGTIALDRLEKSNLIMIVSESSAQILDEHHEKLKKRLSQTFHLLLPVRPNLEVNPRLR